VKRDFKCVFGCNCCAGCSCCSMEISVEAPVGQTIGYVKQESVHASQSPSCNSTSWSELKSDSGVGNQPGRKFWNLFFICMPIAVSVRS